MEIRIVIAILVVLAFLYAWYSVDPKLDWNYETEERLLWFNDPFDSWIRKPIRLYRKKN